MTNPSKLSLYLPVLWLIISCSSNSRITGDPGTGSETTNGFAALVVHDNDTPVVGAKVSIRTQDYLRDTSKINSEDTPDATTDSLGAFYLDSIDTGKYFIEVTAGEDSAVLVECTQEGLDTGLTNLGKIKILPAASFSGNVDKENIPDSVAIFIQVYGTDHVAKAGPDGKFQMKHIPPGKHRLRIISSDPSFGVADSQEVLVVPDGNKESEKFLMPFEFWRDTVVVRAILDSNGLHSTPVQQVAKKHRDRISDLILNRRGITVLPGIIGKLRLRTLQLGENEIDSLPPELGRMRSLHHLNIEGNKLSKLPESFFNLRGLDFLNLDGNQLASIPDKISQLKRLRFLAMDNNQLAAMPKSIVTLRELDHISIDFNNLCSLSQEQEEWIDKFSKNTEWKATQNCP